MGTNGPLVLVSATANPHKLDEIRDLLAGIAEVRPRPADVPEVVEDADTLAGNAELKCAAIVRATGCAAVADDTGLEVDALGGAPGVHSARYAGLPSDDTANVARLLADLAAADAHDPAQRTARFRTVAVVGWPDGRRLVAEGTVEGVIASAPRGTDGFGYDPVFEPEGGGGRTFAEMTAADKHALSHRGRAMRTLAELLVAPSTGSSGGVS